jgi:hypothetical protein
VVWVEICLVKFRVGATFEMRTVLYGIRLLIDKVETHDRVFISNNFCGEEGKTAERQRERERECVCERQRVGKNWRLHRQ